MMSIIVEFYRNYGMKLVTTFPMMPQAPSYFLLLLSISNN